MIYNDNATKLYLLVDIDDLLVRSSDKLQMILDEKTNFKTNVLRMLEQLNRNCSYLLNQVQNECEQAEKEKRKPELNQFLVFQNFDLEDSSLWYTKPISTINYYLDVAKLLLNEFLEERDTFLEIDNMPKGKIKTFNYKKEMEVINKYANLVSNNKYFFHLINTYCLKKAERLINDAKKKNMGNILTIPEYGALVSMDTNDILKKNSIKETNDIGYRENILYQKPLDDINNCLILEDRLYDIINNATVFISPSKEIVDYDSIHSLKNVNWDAVKLVEKLIHSGLFNGVYFSTHHNGYREEKAKKILMKKILPEASGFIGQRFHSNEHNAIRRGRSSKVDNAVDYLMIEPKQIVLLDDSKANCSDCKVKGGTELLYKPVTDSEIIKGRLEETGHNRILDFSDKKVFEYVQNAYAKAKVKRK